MAWNLALDVLCHGRRERWLLKCACAVQCQAAAIQLVIRNGASLINNSYNLDNWLALETVVAFTKQRMRQRFGEMSIAMEHMWSQVLAWYRTGRLELFQNSEGAYHALGRASEGIQNLFSSGPFQDACLSKNCAGEAHWQSSLRCESYELKLVCFDEGG